MGKRALKQEIVDIIVEETDDDDLPFNFLFVIADTEDYDEFSVEMLKKLKPTEKSH